MTKPQLPAYGLSGIRTSDSQKSFDFHGQNDGDDRRSACVTSICDKFRIEIFCESAPGDASFRGWNRRGHRTSDKSTGL